MEKYSPRTLLADWAYGNIYHRATNPASQHDKVWTQLRTVPGAIHVYDVIGVGKKWLYTASATINGGEIGWSDDQAKSWKTKVTSFGPWQRTRSLFALSSSATTSLKQITDLGEPTATAYDVFCSTSGGKVYRYRPSDHDVAQINPPSSGWFAGHSLSSDMFMVRVQVMTNQDNNPGGCRELVVYIGGTKLNDHDWISQDVYILTHPLRAPIVKKTLLPAGIVKVYDLKQYDGDIYALASVHVPEQALYDIRILRIKNEDLFAATKPTNGAPLWRSMITFKQPGLGRSFVKVGEYWYVGIGCEPTNQVSACGTIIRVPANPAVAPAVAQAAATIAGRN